jgi:GTP pyrophosphokinase
VQVDWGPRGEQSVYPVTIVIAAWDRAGLLRDIANAVSEERVSMASLSAETHPDGRATVTATLRIAGIDQLSRLFTRVERVKGVLEVQRRGRRQQTSRESTA